MSNLDDLVLRKPKLEDGLAVNELVASCPPLDANSSYCNFLQCSHFADTCIAAEADDQILGFVSAYPIPSKPDTLFVWQIAVHESARGQSLAPRMLERLLKRPACEGIHFLETTITSSNSASRRVFERLAAELNANLQVSPWLDSERHFDSLHPSEPLVRIGPFNQPREDL
ncbi:diaminobutyrate acetyltransferase [Teredinibacter turnerae]|uniref:diaminobutyrate acetyltransferase n=1 Tax=Teredinibacter turnerae TaxID=2426 RepID=UPI0005F7A23D|nr:diaminobutyrate acetyltransferase [Teredinibacter turnerae]